MPTDFMPFFKGTGTSGVGAGNSRKPLTDPKEWQSIKEMAKVYGRKAK